MMIHHAARSVLLLALAPLASADLINWDFVRITRGTSDVRSGGDLVTARNLWAPAPASPMIAGIEFTAWAPPGWTIEEWALNAASTTGDAGYDAMLNSARATSFGSPSNPNGPGAIRLDTLGTLEVGRTYEIQIWYSDQRAGNVFNDRRMTFSSATGAATLSGGFVQNLASLTRGPDSGFVDADSNNQTGAGDNSFGMFVVGTFTRTTNDPLYLLVEGSHPTPGVTLRPQINGFQVRDLGEADVGTSYCTANANSSGVVAVTSATGSNTAADNNLTLWVRGLPPNVFGIFVVSRTQASVPLQQGTLCLGGTIGRYQGIAEIFQSNAAREARLAIDITRLPQGMVFATAMPGETWNFQAWHRDSVPGTPNTANLSLPTQVTFQ